MGFASSYIEGVSSRSLQLSSVPLPRSLSVADSTGSLSLLCSHAREAAAEGRFLAAHHFFQGALGCFDRAQWLASRGVGNVSASGNDAKNVLVDARVELDDCARQVYSEVTRLAPTPRAEGGSR